MILNVIVGKVDVPPASENVKTRRLRKMRRFTHKVHGIMRAKRGCFCDASIVVINIDMNFFIFQIRII